MAMKKALFMKGCRTAIIAVNQAIDAVHAFDWTDLDEQAAVLSELMAIEQRLSELLSKEQPK